MEIDSILSNNPGSAASPRPPVDKATMDVALKLESTFIAELLKSAGVGETLSDFGGGVGEDQFGSFLRELQAKEVVKSGGIGLAEQFYKSLKNIVND